MKTGVVSVESIQYGADTDLEMSQSTSIEQKIKM